MLTEDLILQDERRVPYAIKVRINEMQFAFKHAPSAEKCLSVLALEPAVEPTSTTLVIFSWTRATL